KRAISRRPSPAGWPPPPRCPRPTMRRSWPNHCVAIAAPVRERPHRRPQPMSLRVAIRRSESMLIHRSLLAVALAGVTTVACQQDNRNIERKLDQIIQMLSQNKGAGGGAVMGGPAGPQQGAAPRAARPEPDRSKTYAVPIAGDPSEGPTDAP